MKVSAKEKIDQVVDDTVADVKHAAADRYYQTCDRAKQLVRENPVPTVLGALVFGAAVAFLVFSRREDSLCDRLHDEKSHARHLFKDARGRVYSLINDGREAASRGADRASSFFHDLPTGEVVDSVSGAVNRLCNRIKFW